MKLGYLPLDDWNSKQVKSLSLIKRHIPKISALYITSAPGIPGISSKLSVFHNQLKKQMDSKERSWDWSWEHHLERRLSQVHQPSLQDRLTRWPFYQHRDHR